MKLNKEILIYPAYDKRSENPKKDYGICGCRIWFIVRGKKGAITLNFFTNWFLSSTIKEYKEGIYKNNLATGGKEKEKTKIDLNATQLPITSGSWDVHSKKPQFEGQDYLEYCDFIGGKCYCDGSCLRAEDYLKILLEKGSKVLFEHLEKDYKIQFQSETK